MVRSDTNQGNQIQSRSMKNTKQKEAACPRDQDRACYVAIKARMLDESAFESALSSNMVSPSTL
eukprot:m.55357 g.55357  ORF g.55357 m.55357 type:complete len:64 (-) comp11485_c0_seq1:4400-4591(-)